tara:strand:- start:193 stop:612 length:420 start_codon:yes stop_codon:yes gene_type:complete
MKNKFSIIDVFIISFITALIFAPLVPVSAQESPRFVSAIDDLPLMDGLVEDLDSSTVFETSSGRIIEVFASGVLKQDQLLAFYDKTLPQLGWLRMKPGLFKREGETLSLEFSAKSKGQPISISVLTVRFHIKPISDKNN